MNPASIKQAISENARVNNFSTTVTDGSDDGFKGRGYLHLGAEYEVSANSRIRINAYNLLGLIDDDLSIRNTFWRAGLYRKEPVSFTISYLRYF